MVFENSLDGTEFEKDLAKSLLAFIPKHFGEAVKDLTLDYESIGTEREQKLKIILHHFTRIRTVLKDLDYTLMFLSKERKLILDHYPDLHSQKAYYNYHFENYYIRLVTLSDILGRFGAELYELGLDPKKTSAHVFKDRARKEGHEKISEITERIILHLEMLKEARHKKLHTGETDIEPLKGIMIWEDLNSIIGTETSSLLKEHTDSEVVGEMKRIESETLTLVSIMKEWLGEGSHKLKQLIG